MGKFERLQYANEVSFPTASGKPLKQIKKRTPTSNTQKIRVEG